MIGLIKPLTNILLVKGKIICLRFTQYQNIITEERL